MRLNTKYYLCVIELGLISQKFTYCYFFLTLNFLSFETEIMLVNTWPMTNYIFN